MSILSILTPTFNRRKYIQYLYESLNEQSIMDFEWIVVDDGSTDETKEYIKGLNINSKFPIKYIFKENGGKHTAINTGLLHIDTPLTMIVDSDDCLTPNAVELIENYYRKYNSDLRIGAFSFLRCDKNGHSILSLDQEEFVDSYIKYRIRKNRPGDMAEVFYTRILNEFPFPEYKNEKFLSEDVNWIRIGLKYMFVFINQAIYQCEYLKDGLTANDKPIKFASPKGSMLRGKMLMKRECGLLSRLKGAIIYNCYRLQLNSDIPENLKPNHFDEIFLLLITKLIGRYYFIKWKN